MDVTAFIGLSSAAGVVILPAIGYFFARGFSKDTGSPELLNAEQEARTRAEQQVTALTQQHEQLSRQLSEERAKQTGGTDQVRALTEERSRAVASRDQLQNQLQSETRRLTEHIHRIEAEAAQLRTAAGAARQPSPDAQRLNDENARLRAQLGEFSSALEAERGRAQKRDAEVNEARAQAQAAQGQLAQAQKQAQAAAAQLQKLQGQAEGGANAQALATKAQRLEAENAQLQTKLRASAQLSTELQAEKTRAQGLETKFNEIRTRSAEVEVERNRLKQAAADADADRNRLRQALAEMQASQQKASAPAQVDPALMAQVEQAANDLKVAHAEVKDLKAKFSAAGRALQDMPNIKNENSALRAELAELRKEQENSEDAAALQRKNVEYSLRIRALEQHQEELELKASEANELRERVDMLSTAEAEVEKLRRTVRDLEAQGFAIRATNVTPTPEQPAAPIRTGGEELEIILERNLDNLVRDEKGCLTAVLADMHGLLIASAGALEHQDELAAAASLTTYMTERLRELLPMGEPISMQLMDLNRVVLRTRWLRWEEEGFLLATLGVDPGQMDSRAESVSATLSELIGSG